MKRLSIHTPLLAATLAFCCSLPSPATAAKAHLDQTARLPNILFCIADDWGWPHASAYGDPVVKTPVFDRLADEGILFKNAYISSPSCTPSRNAILTGQYHWRLDTGASLYGALPQSEETYPHLLEKAGYKTGHWRKAWGPGKLEGKWADKHPAGENYKGGFAEFMESLPEGQPFCFWLGASDPHRGYKLHSGAESGMNLHEIELFEHFPDSPEVRGDVADYYFEVQRFDSDVGNAIALLEEKGLLDNTIIVVTGDHGMPFPRCKSNLYDAGARVPLAVRWGDKIKPGRVIEDFVSTTDLAPTFLEIAGLDPLDAMTGKSLTPLFKGNKSGRTAEDERPYVLTGKERHVPSQEAPNSGGYPMRALRNHDFLLIKNYAPDRWPNGTPNHQKAFIPGAWYADTDNGPTKSYIVDNKDKDDEHRRAYELCFGFRPEIELYDLAKDPGQLNNIADDPEYTATLKKLIAQLDADLEETKDPRAVGNAPFDTYPYGGGAPKFPGLRKEPKKKK
ncbi:MAG: sulfatase [Verrucomicrobiota bacterium]